eukprot:812963-Amphidinium_carterae.1
MHNKEKGCPSMTVHDRMHCIHRVHVFEVQDALQTTDVHRSFNFFISSIFFAQGLNLNELSVMIFDGMVGLTGL